VQTESATKGNPIWFKGIDDELYAKIQLWQKLYWSGEVHSTRKFMTPQGVVDKPTKTVHYIPFRYVELDRLVMILEALRPNTPILEEWRRIRSMFHSAKPLTYLPYIKSYWGKARLPRGIHRVFTLAFFPEHVNEILSILNEAKTGQAIQAAEARGKDLFEQ